MENFSATQDKLVFSITPLQRGWDIVGPLYETFLYGLGFVAGGFANHAATIVGENERFAVPLYDQPPAYGDIDIYALDADALKAIEKNLTADGWEKISESPYSFKFTRSVPTDKYAVIEHIAPTLNLIKMKTGTPEEVLSSFDLSVCQAAILSDREVFVSNAWKVTHVHKLLTAHNIDTPASTMLRIAKYYKRGYQPSYGVIATVLESWRTMPEETREKQLKWIEEHADARDEMYWKDE